MSKKPLEKKTLFFYGLSDAPVMLASFPMMLYMNKFYATDQSLVTENWAISTWKRHRSGHLLHTK
ncbi:MAG: hypothetical protein O3C68_03310 [Proteobacteria bacterium]|nr:hypothetical protein [Pseudomonadota bacterium]